MPLSHPLAATMKTNSAIRILLLVAVLGFIGGCATPESRISRNQEYFNQLTPAQQDLIRHGQIQVGFAAEMVRLALGEPDRYTTRTDANGTSEVWHYITYAMPSGAPLYRGWWHHYYAWRDPGYPWYLDYDRRVEVERLSVVFRGGIVQSIEYERPR